MKWSIYWSALAFAVATTAPVSAAIVSLNASKDNTLIQQTNPAGQLSNGTGDIFVGRTGQDGSGPTTPTISIRRGLIAFDLSAIPSGSTITGAALTMRDVMGNNGDRDATLHRVMADWGEGASFSNGGAGAAAKDNDATWLYRFFNESDPTASPAWSTPGGDFSPVASAVTTIIGNTQNLASFVSWSDPGMVADLQFWLDNPTQNFGWLIRGVENVGMTAKRLNGRLTHVTSDVVPVLMVTYVPEPGTMVMALILGVGIGLTDFPRRRK